MFDNRYGFCLATFVICLQLQQALLSDARVADVEKLKDNVQAAMLFKRYEYTLTHYILRFTGLQIKLIF